MYEMITLPNGVRIAFEKMDNVRSAAVGIWVGVGSRHEKASENGATHFIEHMLFKGTDKYSAQELAAAMDGIGGQINAYTTRESTCYYARVPDYHLDKAIEILSDMFFNPRFDQADVDSERGVILEEIDMYEDSPEDMVVEKMLAKCFTGSLGRPILGKPSTLSAMTGEDLRKFKERRYIAPRVVVALCGRFEDSHIKMIQENFSALEKRKDAGLRGSVYIPCFTVKRKSIEQNHLCLGFPGVSIGSEERFAMNLMSTMLGGGMSSRLFQTIREKHGLCYSIYSFTSSFADTGLFGVTTAVGRETEQKALSLIMEELKRFREEGVTQIELDRAREQAKSNILMSLESTSSRMNRLGSGVLHLGESLDPDELIRRFDAVTREDILRLARKVLDFDEMSFSAVGRVGDADAYRQVLSH